MRLKAVASTTVLLWYSKVGVSLLNSKEGNLLKGDKDTDVTRQLEPETETRAEHLGKLDITIEEMNSEKRRAHTHIGERNYGGNIRGRNRPDGIGSKCNDGKDGMGGTGIRCSTRNSTALTQSPPRNTKQMISVPTREGGVHSIEEMDAIVEEPNVNKRSRTPLTITKSVQIRSPSALSEKPNDDFDLEVCETYNTIWVGDMRNSCMTQCRCYDAERRLARGEISCDEEPLIKQCPDECPVCNQCLGGILGNYCKDLHSKSQISQSASTNSMISRKLQSTSFTHVPTLVPTALPTLTSRPTCNDTSSPTITSMPSAMPAPDDFDLNVCETYEEEWASDLRESCLMDRCRCYDAEMRLDSGEISCTGGRLVNNCPDGCHVCRFCLGDVIRGYCDGFTFRPSIAPSDSPMSLPPHLSTDIPSISPTASPNVPPSRVHTSEPSFDRTASPSLLPTIVPTLVPTILPSSQPSSQPDANPSTMPTPVDFDLNVCETYEAEWARDLRETCLTDNTRCKCYDAQRRLSSGEISCREGSLVNQCPDDCDVCRFCLGDVLRGYCDGITPQPTISPTLRPTPLPSFGPTLSKSNPPTPFDILNCQAYEDEWLADVIDDGICDAAKTLISEGRLDCQVAICPGNCVVCKFCLESLDCSPKQIGAPSSVPTTTDLRSPKGSPTSEPSSRPSSTPSRRPTFFPSFGPTLVQSEAPTLPTTFAPTTLPPSPAAFDLSDCQTYSNNWISELVVTGRCESAEELIDKKIISCGLDRCPTECGICIVCFSSLNCEQGAAPSTSPLNQPLPTPGPTTSQTVSLSDNFDLSNCNTYAANWLFDLARSCDRNPTVDQTQGCRCDEAETKINNGFIVCGIDVCPEDCSACEFCLYDVLDCRPEPAS